MYLLRKFSCVVRIRFHELRLLNSCKVIPFINSLGIMLLHNYCWFYLCCFLSPHFLMTNRRILLRLLFIHIFGRSQPKGCLYISQSLIHFLQSSISNITIDIKDSWADEANLLAELGGSIVSSVKADANFVIPCKPSFPGVTVKLTRADGIDVSIVYICKYNIECYCIILTVEPKIENQPTLRIIKWNVF